MRKMVFALLLLAGATACNGQAEKKKEAGNHSYQVTPGRPQGSWKVNKHYDDKGNLIGYDSTYVWSYSSRNGQVQDVNADSVMAAFRKQFDVQFPSVFSHSFGEPIWNDSLFHRDFTGPDYFINKWESDFFDMRKMMERMDSLRNDFLRNNYPGLKTEEKKELLPKRTL
jgi:hypothetical protein